MADGKKVRHLEINDKLADKDWQQPTPSARGKNAPLLVCFMDPTLPHTSQSPDGQWAWFTTRFLASLTLTFGNGIMFLEMNLE